MDDIVNVVVEIPFRSRNKYEISNGKEDYKLISVVACDPRYDDIKSLDDISSFTLEEIKNFFENYKKLENVEVRVGKYHSCSEALKILKECEERYNEE